MSKSKKIVIGGACGIFIVTLGIIGFLYYKTNKVLTVLTLDINPSVKLSLNYKDEIVKAEGLNEDGKELLKIENFKGDDLEDAIEEIAELVVEKGYITEEDNHILVNVDGKDINDKVVSLINKEFKEEKVECNVIVQKISDGAKNNAEKYGISESKASYIEEIIKENENLTFEDLKDKSINEINKYVENNEVQEDNKQEENPKEEDNKEESNTNNNNNVNNNTNNGSSSNNNNNSNSNNGNSSSNKKPVVNSTPPAADDRTGAWCEFYKTIPPEGGVEYETPGFINDSEVYVDASKKYMPADSNWDTYYSSITQYKTASYCSAGIVEVENSTKTKKYKAYLDSVTLELLKPIIVTELEKPKIDEAGAKVIVTKWLSDTYKVDINTCGGQYFYYAIDGSTNKPEWQFSCKVEETNRYYAVVVNAIDGSLSLGRTW